MAHELVLGRLQTPFLGDESVTSGTDRTIVMPVDNRMLRAAWLSIANVALPAVAAQFAVPMTTVQWATLSYLLTMTISVVLVISQAFEIKPYVL